MMLAMFNCSSSNRKMSAASCMKLAVFLLVQLVLFAPAVLGAPPRGWSSGRITYYGSPNGGGTQGGACGYQNTVSLGYGFMTAALSTPLFNGGAACGACYQLQCAPVHETPKNLLQRNWCWKVGRRITITATNLCPPGSEGGWCDPPQHHFDLPMPAFTALAKREGGVVPIYYRRVRCAKQGGIRFTMGGNPWFLMILIHNVAGAGDVVAVKIKCPTSDWCDMYRNWGAFWTVQKKMEGPLSFQITTGDRRKVTTHNAVGHGWQFGQTWEGAQYR
ncbi:expansin-A11 [Physcomitrium patens]|uniref:Expansin n=1 Tax=Physcomitrium patens TaxID=3218 RepID=A0A2K1KBJ3_PHYPA|nr:expansin-A11-like [Physcomitrium patens]PNR51139.1 hypothetical protein PHYPA_010325 [Physcomitrium patens]|eukprot:XP_024380581.1 expansin-A11-like [Physcomitrella patens]